MFLVSVSVIEFLISYIVFSHVAELKRSKILCFVLGSIIFISAVPINIILGNNIIINGLYFAFINILTALSFFYISPLKAIFYSVVLDIFSTALEFATIILFSFLFNVGIEEYNSNNTLLIIEGVASKLLYFIVSIILIRLISKDRLKARFPLSFFIYPLSVLFAFISIWKVCLVEELSQTSQTVFSIVIIILFASTVLLFITYQHNIEKENGFVAIQGELDRLQTEKSYYDILDAQDEQLLTYAHDAKNHIITIKNLNKDEQIDKYIDEMSESLKTYNSISRSGNKILDVIINKYTTECTLKNISFAHDVRVSNLKCIDDFDLVTILGNLLDNAIEAAEKSTEKSISFETDFRNAYNIIIVSNSCDNAPIIQGSKLMTTKKDSSVHGLGIKNVQRTIQKYNGDLSWGYNPESKSFRATVMIRENRK